MERGGAATRGEGELITPLHPDPTLDSPSWHDGDGEGSLITQSIQPKIVPLPALHKTCPLAKVQECNHTPIWEKNCKQYQIFDSLPYSITVFDKDFGMAYANKAFLTWSGYTESDLIDVNLNDFPFYPRNPLITLKQHLKGAARPFSLFGLIPTPRLGWAPTQAKWSGRFDQKNNLTGYTCDSFCLEKLNKGTPASYATRNGSVLSATKALADILNRSLKEIVGSQALQYYKNPSDREELLRIAGGTAVGEWLPTVYKRKGLGPINVKIRGGRYEHIYRFEIRTT